MDLRDLIALAWKRRWIVLGVLVTTLVSQRAGDPLAADRVRVDRDARAHARRPGGPGARRVRQPLGAAQHLRGDREVERQPRARPAAARAQARPPTSTPRRRAAAASCASPRARPTRGRPPPRRGDRPGVPGLDRRQQADGRDARRPGVARQHAGAAAPATAVRRRRHPRPVRRHPARARVRAVPPPHRHRRRRGAAHARARARAARPPAHALARHRLADLGREGRRRPDGELSRAPHQPRVPDGRLDDA